MSVEYMKSLKRADVQPDGLISIYDSVAKWCADGRLGDTGHTVTSLRSLFLKRSSTHVLSKQIQHTSITQNPSEA